MTNTCDTCGQPLYSDDWRLRACEAESALAAILALCDGHGTDAVHAVRQLAEAHKDACANESALLRIACRLQSRVEELVALRISGGQMGQ